MENVPEGACLLVTYHSTHYTDTLAGPLLSYYYSGRVIRGLMHRTLHSCIPWVTYLGIIPGTRDEAVELLKTGHVVAVLPGGAEEALTGHENAYKLHAKWDERRGYVKVAMEANVPILPCFTRNVEEMRFNPIFYLWNLLGLGKTWTSLFDLPYGVGSACKWIALVVWYFTMFLSIPVPVKCTSFTGKPIYPKPGQTADELADEVKNTLQGMMDKYQPHGHAYLPGIIENFATTPTDVYPSKAKTE